VLQLDYRFRLQQTTKYNKHNENSMSAFGDHLFAFIGLALLAGHEGHLASKKNSL